MIMSLPKSILHWSIGDVAHWLAENHFEVEILDFKEHQIDGKALALLQKSDIKELIKRIGPRVKFRSKLSHLLSSRGLTTTLSCYDKTQTTGFNKEANGNYYQPASYNIIPVYQQQQQQQQQQQNVVQHVRYPNTLEQPHHQYYPQQQQQQQPKQQSVKSITQYHPYNKNVYAVNNTSQSQQQNPLYQVTNHSSRYQTIRPMNVQQQTVTTNNNNFTVDGNSITVKAFDYRSFKQLPVAEKHQITPLHQENKLSQQQIKCCSNSNNNNNNNNNNNSNNNSNSNQSNNSNSNQSNNDNVSNNVFDCDEVEITRFVKGSGFIKQEPIDENIELTKNANKVENVNNVNTAKSNDTDDQVEDHTKYNQKDEKSACNQVGKHARFTQGNDTVENQVGDVTEETQDYEAREGCQRQQVPENEKENFDITVAECLSSDGESINGSYDGEDGNNRDAEFASMVLDNISQDYHDEEGRYPVLDISTMADDYCFENGDNKLNKQDQQQQKLGIEAVTNRLALRERSKIFRRSEKKWHVAVNETAYQMALKDPKLLLRKKDLRLMAESEVRKTYRFAKGKSRSIAIPENRLAAEERKKQRLTKEKIIELKRQVTAEGEEVSRKMRQCHMNLTLSSQQSDEMKTRDLREEMQKLNQQQAKLHFTMDELIKKENKLVDNATPVSNDKYSSFHFQQQQQHQQHHQQQPHQQQAYVALNEPHAVTYVGQQIPQQITMLSPQAVPLPQVISPQLLSPQVISPQISIVSSQQVPTVSPVSQVHVDQHGRVLQLNGKTNTPLVIYGGDNRDKCELNGYVNM